MPSIAETLDSSLGLQNLRLLPCTYLTSNLSHLLPHNILADKSGLLLPSSWRKLSTEKRKVSPSCPVHFCYPSITSACEIVRIVTDIAAERMDFTTSKEVTVAPTFEDMHLKENLLRGIYAYGYESPSAVQSRAIVQICKGRDTIAQAQSGTGKTATFSISILQVLETTIRETQGRAPSL